jgi:hypothetical protein
MEEPDNRTKLKQWLASGEVRLQPLSFSQRELWETSPVPVGDSANHICAFIEITGGITPEKCEAALRRVMERQEALRVSFLPGKDRTLEMIRATSTPQLGYRELSAAEVRPEALEEVLQETYRKPFDLLQGPLYRVDMLKRRTGDHVLAFSVHHSIADGWSLGVFVQDLSTAYVMDLKGMRKAMATGVLGLSDKLPPVPQTYSEWSASERAFWQPAEIEQRAGFWREQLQGAPQVFSEREGVVRNKGPLRRMVSAMNPRLTKAVKEMAQKHGATLYSSLLSVFQVTLWKWLGKDDLVVGSPVANRNKSACHQTMGYFAGVVPIRGQVDPGRAFSDHLKAVHARAVDCFANAMPFAEIAKVVGEQAAGVVHPLFDVRFALQNHPVPDVVLPRISTKLRMRSTGTARFDLGCEITETGSELEVVWLYRHDIFNEVEIRALDGMFREVTTQLCSQSGSRLTDLKL